MFNTQAVSKTIPANIEGDVLNVSEVFYTIQGEGPNSGRPAIFVRLAGCNLQCPFCDTDYTSVCDPWTIQQLIDECSRLWNPHCSVLSNSFPLIVLTGGEPFRQPIREFTDLAMDYEFEVQIETNGTLFRQLDFKNELLSIVCSPKTHHVAKELVPHVNAWKYIGDTESLKDTEDGLPSYSLGLPVKQGRSLYRAARMENVYLSPADEQDEERNEANRQACVETCLEFGHTLSLQTHKIVGVK